MAKLSLRLGIVLAAIGVLFWVITGFEHFTSLIPTGLGIPISICGFLSIKKPEKSVLYMHIAVVLAFILFLGAGRQVIYLEEFGTLKAAAIWPTFLISFFLIGAFVQSFLKARAAKKS